MIVLRAFACALGFLTRIPAPRVAYTPAVLGLAAGFFPLVGLLLGGLSLGLLALLGDRALHPLWTLGFLALSALATGALHLDGLSDLADGLGGSRGDRERALAIMRDPHVGAFGVVALILFLAAKGFALHDVLRHPRAGWILLAAPVVARFAAVVLLAFVPAARPDGLAASFRERCGLPSLLLAVATTIGVVYWSGLRPPWGVGIGVGLLVGLLASWRLRGVTGDVIGAAVELSELAFLIAARHA
jgi:adenosylcobinamide-GDP ribazoletransferase